jgi:Transposase and inactivated derivatives
MDFIANHKGKRPINRLCEILRVSESGYYKHLRNLNKPPKHVDLLAQIREILLEDEENYNYGVRRIYLALILKKGYTGSFSTVYRVCKENNLMIKRKHSAKGITKADAAAQKAENLIQQDFTADAPNCKWLTDITEVPCSDGKLYLAPVLDCFDGAIVGFKMDDNMRAELCIEAFLISWRAHRAFGIILHSDRGSQFTSIAFRQALSEAGAIQSMSGTGRCYDNARMESFFATLKKEKLYQMDTTKMPKAMVKSIIYRYINYYNRKRIYSTNDGLPPFEKRNLFYQGVMAA